MSAAAGPSGSDPGELRRLLARAQDYAVFTGDGRRIGTLIELVGADAGCERVAIRYERIFLWRRRLLPLETVARVVPEQRAVLLTLDRQLLDRLDLPGDEMEGTHGPSAEGVRPRSDWLERIERYNAGGQGERAELKRGPDAGREPPPTERRQEPVGCANSV